MVNKSTSSSVVSSSNALNTAQNVPVREAPSLWSSIYYHESLNQNESKISIKYLPTLAHKQY